MQKKSVNLISFFIAIVLIVTITSVNALADETAPEMPCFDLPCSLKTVKVGLYHGSSAMSEVNLSCKTGNGFELGFYDFSRSFHKIGELDASGLAIRANVGEGAWHILLNQSCDSFESANAVALSIGGFVGYVNNSFVVLAGAYESESEAASAIANRGLSGSAFTGSGNAFLVCSANYSKALFLYDSASIKLAVVPKSSDGETWLGERSYKGGFTVYRSGNALCVTNFVALEDYVKGVLPYEVSADWPEEALKAQAVCARTYAFNCINEYSERDFDVRDDTYSQVYKGTTYNDAVINSAAESTAGKFVRFDGAVCRVYYMSSDGGGTEDGVNVFGERRKYLAAVDDTFEASGGFYGKTWTETMTPAQLSYDLRDHGFDIGDVVKIDTTYSDMGNVVRLDFTDAEGKTAFLERRECYSVLGLNSIRYDVLEEESENGDVTFVFDGCGWGHNCGMSQWGACIMAENSNVRCDDIISYYFSGAYIA